MVISVTHPTPSGGEVNEDDYLAEHTVSGVSLEGHDHDGTPDTKLTQANTHESPDTDSATSALHHTLGTGANQAAVGTHSHAGAGYIGYIILKDIQTANTPGGTFTTGAWRTRVLNTEELDSNNDCSLSSNQFTLAAGTYDIEASAPAWFVNAHQTRLFNVTDTATILPGTSEYAPTSASDASQTRSRVIGRFTIGASKALELQHNAAATRSTNGFGVAANFGISEIYAVVRLWRVS